MADRNPAAAAGGVGACADAGNGARAADGYGQISTPNKCWVISAALASRTIAAIHCTL
jgi:hypothetical protein